MKADIAEVLEAIAELSENEEDIQAIVQKVVGLIQTYAPEFKPLYEGMSEYNAKQRIKLFKQYTDAGFTREETMLLILNSRVALAEALSNMKSK